MDYEHDKQFDTYVLDEVREHDDSYTLCFDRGTCLGLDKKYGVVPKEGDELILWGRGLGFRIRGLKVGGKVAYYRSAEQEELYAKASSDILKGQKIIDWFDDKDGGRTKFEAGYDALPFEMRRRIDRFRSNNSCFDWEFGPYELMCCQQALALAETLEALAFISERDLEEVYEAFGRLGYEEEGEVFPERDDGHSGNSWGFTRRLAGLWLFNRELVWAEHGALVHLVGCEEYGCPPVDESELVPA